MWLAVFSCPQRGARNRKGGRCPHGGGSAEAYSAQGSMGDINELLAYVTRGIFSTAGLDVITPFIAFSASSISSEQRQELLERYRQQLLAL